MQVRRAVVWCIAGGDFNAQGDATPPPGGHTRPIGTKQPVPFVTGVGQERHASIDTHQSLFYNRHTPPSHNNNVIESSISSNSRLRASGTLLSLEAHNHPLSDTTKSLARLVALWHFVS